MRAERISGRQFGLLTLLAMMAPLIHAVPTRTAAAGRASWLAAVPAALPLGVLLWALFHALARLPEGSGLADLYLLGLGRRWGMVCCALSGVWLLMILVADLRFCAERYVTAVYPDTGRGMFYLSLLALALWMGRGSLAALARAGTVLFWVVTVTLVVVLAMAAPRMHIYNVWPVTDTRLEQAGAGALRLSAVVSLAVPFSFLLGQVERRGARKGVLLWLGGLTTAMVCIAAVIFGVFGPELAGELQVPFFALAKEISLRRTIQGIEVVVAAMWVMSDAALTGAVLFALGELVCRMIPRWDREMVRTAAVCLLVPLCLLLPRSSFRMERLYIRYGLPMNLAAGYLLPALALVAGRVRKRW